jgi:hypothetical protein
MTYREWMKDYWENRCRYERLGQAFCNDFIAGSWPELYNCTVASQSAHMIENWLHQNHYFSTMPNKVFRG